MIVAKIDKSCTDRQILDLCTGEPRDQLNAHQRELRSLMYCGTCEIQQGPLQKHVSMRYPPQNTGAVVLNISTDGGALIVWNPEEEKIEGSFGTEKLEHMENWVIIKWRSVWMYYTLGTCYIKYVVRAS